jgi:MraZ protein
MFEGRYKATMDAKSRLVLPRSFREISRGVKWDEGVLTSGFDDCLFLYTRPQWDELIASPALRVSGLPTVEMMLFQRLFAGSGHPVVVDRFNRIAVPQELREEAGLSGECVWVGAVSRAELWSAERWRQHMEQSRGKLREIWDQIALRGQKTEADTHGQVVQGQVEAPK